MKIGIYLLDAVVTGTTKYVFELAAGLREAGHEVHTLSSTKSGREPVRWTKSDGGARWWYQAPDVTVAHDDLASTLNYFDLVIVNDIGSSTLDSEDHSKTGLPGYVLGLLSTKTPWIPVAHGNSYDAKHAPHFPKLLAESVRPPKAVLATSAPYDYAEHELFRTLTPVYMKRPYAARYGEYAEPSSGGQSAIAIGRFSTGKNLHALGLTLPFVGPNTHALYLAGACISSARPTDSYVTYEELSARDNIMVSEEPASKNKTAPWSLRGPRGTSLSYFGAYTDPLPYLERSKLFVNLTSSSFSAGTEYTTMEAMDAGCLILTTRHMIDADSGIAFGVLEPWSIPTTPKKTLKTCEEELKILANRIDVAMSAGYEAHLNLSRHNRSVLQSVYKPSVVAKKLISDLEGVEV